MIYPHKWSPISYRSSAGQGKLASQRLTFYRCATQPGKDCMAVIRCQYPHMDYKAFTISASNNAWHRLSLKPTQWSNHHHQRHVASEDHSIIPTWWLRHTALLPRTVSKWAERYVNMPMKIHMCWGAMDSSRWPTCSSRAMHCLDRTWKTSALHDFINGDAIIPTDTKYSP